MPYIIARFFLFILSKLFFEYRVYGRGRVPKIGGVIIAPNHASYLDPIFIGIGTQRPVSFIARETLFRNFIFGNLIRMVHAFPIKRNFQDLGAMREAVLRLKKKQEVLLIFPEATRTKDGNLQQAKAGISFLAHSAGVPVVPVYIKGNYEVWPKGAKHINPAPVSVYFGEPLDFEEFLKQKRYDKPQDAYQPFADYIMENISSLRTICSPQ